MKENSELFILSAAIVFLRTELVIGGALGATAFTKQGVGLGRKTHHHYHPPTVLVELVTGKIVAETTKRTPSTGNRAITTAKTTTSSLTATTASAATATDLKTARTLSLSPTTPGATTMASKPPTIRSTTTATEAIIATTAPPPIIGTETNLIMSSSTKTKTTFSEPSRTSLVESSSLEASTELPFTTIVSELEFDASTTTNHLGSAESTASSSFNLLDGDDFETEDDAAAFPSSEVIENSGTTTSTSEFGAPPESDNAQSFSSERTILEQFDTATEPRTSILSAQSLLSEVRVTEQSTELDMVQTFNSEELKTVTTTERFQSLSSTQATVTEQSKEAEEPEMPHEEGSTSVSHGDDANATTHNSPSAGADATSTTMKSRNSIIGGAEHSEEAVIEPSPTLGPLTTLVAGEMTPPEDDDDLREATVATGLPTLSPAASERRRTSSLSQETSAAGVGDPDEDGTTTGDNVGDGSTFPRDAEGKISTTAAGTRDLQSTQVKVAETSTDGVITTTTTTITSHTPSASDPETTAALAFEDAQAEEEIAVGATLTLPQLSAAATATTSEAAATTGRVSSATPSDGISGRRPPLNEG